MDGKRQDDVSLIVTPRHQIVKIKLDSLNLLEIKGERFHSSSVRVSVQEYIGWEDTTFLVISKQS